MDFPTDPTNVLSIKHTSNDILLFIQLILSSDVSIVVPKDELVGISEILAMFETTITLSEDLGQSLDIHLLRGDAGDDSSLQTVDVGMIALENRALFIVSGD